jgi:Ca2+-binding EF-hand superfamily protein
MEGVRNEVSEVVYLRSQIAATGDLEGNAPAAATEQLCEQLEVALGEVAVLRRTRRELRSRIVRLLRKAFELCDVDGDGTISVGECTLLEQQVAQVQGQALAGGAAAAARSFAALDGDGDGEVTLQEYVASHLDEIPPHAYAAALDEMESVVAGSHGR